MIKHEKNEKKKSFGWKEFAIGGLCFGLGYIAIAAIFIFSK